MGSTKWGKCGQRTPLDEDIAYHLMQSHKLTVALAMGPTEISVHWPTTSDKTCLQFHSTEKEDLGTSHSQLLFAISYYCPTVESTIAYMVSYLNLLHLCSSQSYLHLIG